MSKVDLDRFIDFMVEYKKEIIEDYEKELGKFRPFTSAYEMKKEIERLKEEIKGYEQERERGLNIIDERNKNKAKKNSRTIRRNWSS